MAEAEDELAQRKGGGNQDLWEAARLGNFDRVMDLLFRCGVCMSRFIGLYLYWVEASVRNFLCACTF